MFFGFDESGSFSIPKGLVTRGAAVVAGVAYPETDGPAIVDAFRGFADSLDPKKKPGREPKGRLLSVKDCNCFCEAFQGLDRLLIEPRALDLTWLTPEQAAGIPRRVYDLLYSKSQECIHESMRKDTELLGRQFRNLSAEQALRIVLLSCCIDQLTRDAVTWVKDKGEDIWAIVQFEIDAVQVQPGNREEQLFRWMLLGWLTAWSQKNPWMTIEEIHTEDHPFMKHYDTGTGFDFTKLFRDNIQFVNSRDSVPVQMADIVATITRRAMLDLQNNDGWPVVFARLMQHHPRASERTLGLVSFEPWMPEEVTQKYGALTAHVEQYRRRRT